MKCQKCQKEVFLPFTCPYCGGYFCPEHRLPEAHECPNIKLAQAPKEETRRPIIQKQKSHEYTVTYLPVQTTRKRVYFSAREVKHLTIAALLVFGIGLSSGIFITYGGLGDRLILVAFASAFTASFLAHEIAHKIVAQMEDLWAEFRLTIFGAVLTLLSIFSIFKIISPGAVMISGFSDKKSIGKISIAGPATNIALAILLLGLAFLVHHPIFAILAFINASIAIFNLIPFGILDGFKIFLWNKKVWASAFTISLVLTLVSYKFIL
jgi:Zn-dependent protease